MSLEFVIKKILNFLRPFQKGADEGGIQYEEDEMNYVRSNFRRIQQDRIHLESENNFEKLAYSYAFAQVRTAEKGLELLSIIDCQLL